MNTTHLHGNRSIQVCIIISLLLHCTIALYVLTNNFQFSVPNQTSKTKDIDTQLPAVNKETEWVETKTRSSFASTPVFFQEHEPPINEQSYDHDTVHPDPDIQKNSDDYIDNVDKKEQQELTEKTSPELEKQLDTQQATTTTPQLPTRSFSSTKKSTTLPPIRAAKPPTQPRSSQKQLPSLSQLTQGMLNYMQENGQHSVSMLGKKHGTPTDEQLKYERYLERLNQCLHNSFVTNSHKQPHYAASFDSSVTVYLALNQDGTIYNLKLVKTSGDTPMDLFVMTVLRDASSSFPPVPHYLPHNPFAIHYIINFGPSYPHRSY